MNVRSVLKLLFVTSALACSGVRKDVEPTDTGWSYQPVGPGGPPPPRGIDRPCEADADCRNDLVCVAASESVQGHINTCQVPCSASFECPDHATCYRCVEDATPAYCWQVGCS